MASNEKALVLPRLTGGINRYRAEASEQQAAEALDVWTPTGELERRPSFRSLLIGPTFVLPVGQVFVKKEYPFNTFTTYTSRAPVFNPDELGGLNGRLWVGCSQPFDGILWGKVSDRPPNADLDRNNKLTPKYRNTSGTLVNMSDVIDTTTYRHDVAGTYRMALLNDGAIAWHRSTFTAWTATTVNGQSAYWVALDLSETSPTPGVTLTAVELGFNSGTLTLAAPGIRCFELGSVKGIFPNRLKNRTSNILTVGESLPRRNYAEKGVGISYTRNPQFPSRDLGIIEDGAEGPAVFGLITYPTWTGGGGGGTIGSATEQILTKRDDTYDWFATQFEQTTITTGTTNALGSTTLIAAAGFNDTRYEGLYVQITSGAQKEQIRQIATATAAGLTVPAGDAFAAAIANGVTFSVITPPLILRTEENQVDYEVSANDADTVTIASGRNYHAALAGEDTDTFVNFEVFREGRFTFEPGSDWVSCFDSVTGKILLCNGRNGILEFDGRRLRRLQAVWDPTEGQPGYAKVVLWRGLISDQAVKAAELGFDVQPGSILYHEPPNARLLVDFNGRLVAVKRDHEVQWSAPGIDNNLWPYLYNTRVRDSESNPIVGIATLNDKLLVWSKTSVHYSPPADEFGMLNFRPISQGIGFVSNHGVAKAAFNGASFLVGPTPDGIAATDGLGVTYLLDSWDRVCKVNQKLLAKSVGCFSLQDATYFLAFASTGSETNDRIIVLDLANKRIWLWSAPWGGCSFIARQLGSGGRERILFGFDDGHVAVLTQGPSDAGSSIEGFARSHPIEVLGGKSFAPTAIVIAARDTGTNTLTIKTFTNQKSQAAQTTTQAFTRAETFNAATADYDTSLWGGSEVLSKKVPIPSGTSGESFTFEVRGTSRWRFSNARLLLTEKGDRAIT